jgi:uncharacterized repeat protein (TIGR04138 family)
MPRVVAPPKSIEQIAADVGDYSVDAFYFVQDGLATTARKLMGPRRRGQNRHLTGQQLALGLRDIAVEQWGLLARTVLERWEIHSTMDFGRIVYAMIDARLMGRSATDSIEDFRNVYDFRKAFDQPRNASSRLVKA